MTGPLRGWRERLSAALWNGIGGALPRLALLVAGLYVAQRFGPDAFARYSLAAVTFALVGSLPGATLSTVASKFVPEFAGGDPSRTGAGFRAIVTLALLLALSLGGAVFALADVVSFALAADPPIGSLLRAAAVAIVASIVAGGTLGLLMGSGRFRAMALAQLGGFAVFAASLVVLSDWQGPAGVLVALALMYAIAAAAAAIVTRAPWRNDRPASVRERLVPLWAFFLPTLIAAGFVVPVVWLCNALLGRSDAPLAELSRFNAAYQWFAVVSFVPAVLAQVEFVRMSQARARGDGAALGDEMTRFTARNAIVMLPLAAIGVAVSPWLAAMYRLDAVDATRTIQLMFAAAFVASLGNPAGLFLAVVDRIWLASALNIAWGIITLAAAWLLRDAGALGTAGAFLIGYATHAVGANAVARRLVARPA